MCSRNEKVRSSEIKKCGVQKFAQKSRCIDDDWWINYLIILFSKCLVKVARTHILGDITG